MGKHRDKWALELISELVLLGRQLSIQIPIEVDPEHEVHRGFIDVAWYTKAPTREEKIYFSVFEIETSKSDWPRIRNNAAKIVSLNPLLVFHIFKPGVRLTKSEREELIQIHHGRKAYIINTHKAIDEMMDDLASLFSRREGISGRIIELTLPTAYIDSMDKLVEEGVYETRGEAFRVALSHLLAEEYGISMDRYCPCSACGSFRVYFDGEETVVCLNCGNIRNVR